VAPHLIPNATATFRELADINLMKKQGSLCRESQRKCEIASGYFCVLCRLQNSITRVLRGLLYPISVPATTYQAPIMGPTIRGAGHSITAT